MAAGRLKHRRRAVPSCRPLATRSAIRSRPDEDRAAISQSWRAARGSLADRRSRSPTSRSSPPTLTSSSSSWASTPTSRCGASSAICCWHGRAAPRRSSCSPSRTWRRNVPAQVAGVAAIASELPVHVVSPRDHNEGVDRWLRIFATGGRRAPRSSELATSTIINRLVGEDVRRTREVREAIREDASTTSNRRAREVADGGLVIDTPGMRELAALGRQRGCSRDLRRRRGAGRGMSLHELRHRTPRCAVKAAVEDSRSADRSRVPGASEELSSLAKLQDERAILERKRQGKIGRRR